MSAKIEYKEKSIRVLLDGELDHHTAGIIRAGIDEALILRKPKTLTLDFGGVTFMDSSGVGLVMGRYRLINTYGGKLQVSGLSVSAYRMMKLAGLQKIAQLTQKEDMAHETCQ